MSTGEYESPDSALDELGARLRDSGQLTVMLDELPTNTGELSEYCNRLQVSGLERDAWRELLSWGEIVKPAHGLRYAHKAGALFRDYCAATNECDALIIAAPLSDDGDAVLLDDRTALVVAVEADKARVILAAVRRMVAAYVRECLRAQADADAVLPDAVLQNLAAQGVEAGTAASVARSHAAIRKRGRPTRCSMSARRAALVGCAAAVAPPIQARNHQLSEVRHE